MKILMKMIMNNENDDNIEEESNDIE